MRKDEKNDIFEKTQFLNRGNTDFIAQLYVRYKNNLEISNEWKEFFDNAVPEDLSSFSSDFFTPNWKTKGNTASCNSNTSSGNGIDARGLFLKYGHLSADLNPINSPNDLHQELKKAQSLTPTSDFTKMKDMYCGKSAIEISHILSTEECDWLIRKFEGTKNTKILDSELKSAMQNLYKAKAFEEFLHKNFTGAKRFSLQGNDSLLCMMDVMSRSAISSNVTDIIIGLPHRGRLNLLANLTNKPIEEIFSHFAKNLELDESIADISYDVKYHIGHKTTIKEGSNEGSVEIAYNPSHLEAVNPVVMGMVRGLINKSRNAMGILLHGDASFPGQGVVAECINMSSVDTYDINGIINIVVNNQIGFTAQSQESRSGIHPTDIAKSTQSPIFHVNAESIEDCINIAKLSIEYRQKFKKDVYINLVGYRKYGHNEGDEPAYTNPVMYEKIKNMNCYYDRLKSSVNSEIVDFCDNFEKEYQKTLESAMQKAQNKVLLKRNSSNSTEFIANFSHSEVKTGLKNVSEVQDIVKKCYTIPANFSANSRLSKQFDVKIDEAVNRNKYDWALGEALAFASIVKSGKNVRITGQDSERGTFSHRHSILSDSKNGEKYNIFKQFSNNSQYEVANSVLSEFAVLGFEYGYSLKSASDLTIWEAQFGDFANGAVTIFDQFLSSAEKKWMQNSGMVLLLPHGYEGQGPEHSSARLERYLQACAEENIIVTNITTPANFFHALRRQILADFRKPLIVMSPKSLLRNSNAVSSAEDFLEGLSFQEFIDDSVAKKDNIEKIIITSGKIYYDLKQLLAKNDIKNTTIVRIEQFYPFNGEKFTKILSSYKNAKSISWIQEEPKNMGAWQFIRDYLEEYVEKTAIKDKKIHCISRKQSASTACGLESIDKKEYSDLMNDVLLYVNK